MDWKNLNVAEKEKIKMRSMRTLWICGILLLALTPGAIIVAFAVFGLQQWNYGLSFIGIEIIWVVAAVFVIRSIERIYHIRRLQKADKAKAENFNKAAAIDIGGAAAVIFLIVITVFLVTWPFRLYGTYQHDVGKEMDYVCFNGDCNYISPDNYSVNFAGTCLTRTDLGSPVQQCGGTINITKYPPESFWYWLTHPSSSSTSEFGLQLPN